MRVLPTLLSALACAAIVTAAAATEAQRAPGVYTSLTTRDAAACARACADDGICMAWSFQRENACALSAVVPAQLDQSALASGYASRAPASLRTEAPSVQVAAVSEPIAAPPEPIAPVEMVSAPITTGDDDGVLLGGPEEGDLRLGLR